MSPLRRLWMPSWSATTMCLLAVAASPAAAQASAGSGWRRSFGSLALHAGIDSYTAFYAMSGTWWNLGDSVAPDFEKDRSFGELWIHPRLDARYPISKGLELHGLLSGGATQTIGADPFDYKGQGAVRFGSAMLGLRGSTGDWRYDAAFGRQLFTLGTGMLLTVGSSNGFSWGGGASAQRRVWAQSYKANVGFRDFTGTAFLVEPDEEPAQRTNTRVQGLSLQWARRDVGKVGLAWLTVPRSEAIYPGDLAPLEFIEAGRDGLEVWHGWVDLIGVIPGLPSLGLRGEFAVERNEITRVGGNVDPMRAGAWMLGASWWARTLPFSPKFSLHVAKFSGDDPETSTYERFDPLFWGNGLDNWWFGANGAYSWLNANLQVQRFIVDAYISPSDIVQLQYVRAGVDEVNSAIQFGQGARFTSSQILVGVPEPGLSNEVYVQYSHVFGPALVATTFLARSIPRGGLRAAAAPVETEAWTTFGLGLTATY